MKKALMLKLGSSALLLGIAAVGCTSDGRPASASSMAPGGAKAARVARNADKALKARRADQAVPLAEQAVALSPRDANYRATLGQAYVLAGRFTSAEASYADAVALDPAPRNRFNLALTQIALGKSEEARAQLASLTGQMPDSDLGLATALAGDKQAGIAMLERAARAEDAGVKARQNLALAYALAGRWTEAQTVAAQDLPPDQLAPRFAQWAKFAKPESSWDQVAALLGVTPVQDPGRPAALALSDAAPATALASAEPTPVAASEPVSVEAAAPVALSEVPAPTDVPVAVVPQAAPAPAMVRTISAPAPVVQRQPVATGGKWVVQLGAFSRPTAVETAWSRFTARVWELAGYAPAKSTFVVGSGTVHRLNLSGFATRNDAVRTCQRIKARGGDCFVRAADGEQPIQWVARNTPTRVAMR